METKAYPGWKNAIEKIMERVNTEGFGVLFSKKELLDYCDIKVPERATAPEWQQHSFEVLDHIDHMVKELSEEYDICLFNVKGQGYKVLHPNDQVEKEPQKHFKKIRREISKTKRSLTNVKTELLSDDKQTLRLNMLTRVAFIRGAMNKKRLPSVPEVPRLQPV